MLTQESSEEVQTRPLARSPHGDSRASWICGGIPWPEDERFYKSAAGENPRDDFTHSLSNTRIGVIGLGYVGLPLAVEFGKKRDVIGFDVDTRRIEALKAGQDSTHEVSDEEIRAAKRLRFTCELTDLADCNVYIVTVPTPIDAHKRPDLTHLVKASYSVGKVLKVGDIVIYESTVYPGSTEEDCVPILEQVSGLTFNKHFFAGYSPERINPGDKLHRVATIKKVTSGSTPEIAEFVNALYAEIITAGTHKAPSIKVAEAAKVIENTQRDLNIALINELAIIFNRMGIDTEDVLLAAGTKWNFLPFRPGLVGGHCIGRRSILSDIQGRGDRLSPRDYSRRAATKRQHGRLCRFPNDQSSVEASHPCRRRESLSDGSHLQGKLPRFAQHSCRRHRARTRHL